MVALVQAPSLLALPAVRHGFTTRGGGCSVGALAGLNLALRAGEAPDRLRENWERAARTLLPEAGAGQVALLDQVHGGAVLPVEAPTGPLGTLGAADALVTTRRGLILAVRTADCLPVLLAAPGGVAAAHAGWRGVAAGVVPAALRALLAATGAAPGEVRVALGPHATRLEVGPEVVEAFAAAGIPQAAWAVGADPGPAGPGSQGGASGPGSRSAGGRSWCPPVCPRGPASG